MIVITTSNSMSVNARVVPGSARAPRAGDLNLIAVAAATTSTSQESMSAFARGTGTARNRSCPANKNLRKSATDLVDARPSLEIARDEDRRRRDESRPWRGADWKGGPAVWNIHSRHRDLPKRQRDRKHWPEFPRRAIRRSMPSLWATPWM